MKIGTKSVLFGVHQFLVHPLFVAEAWRRLYGFPLDPRLWVAFFVHDLGYVGKPDMDGPEGESHVLFGAEVMHTLFDLTYTNEWMILAHSALLGRVTELIADRWSIYATCQDGSIYMHRRTRSTRWRDFCLYHSRFYAKRDGAQYSRLCVADKLVPCITPKWLYFLLGNASGELDEYVARSIDGKYEQMNMCVRVGDKERWYTEFIKYIAAWVDEHRDLKEDQWTKPA